MMIEEADSAKLYDDATRWTVPSRSNPHETYLCELRDYRGNGSCPCTDFRVRFEPLLRQGYTPERALLEKKVELRPGWRRRDALRCFHLVQAHEDFNQHMIRVFENAAKKIRNEAGH